MAEDFRAALEKAAAMLTEEGYPESQQLRQKVLLHGEMQKL